MIFSNHSCEPNIGVQGQIVFVALREIGIGEELTHDWATTDDDDYTMMCRCGAAACRGVVTGKDWRRADLRQNIVEFSRATCNEKSRAYKRSAICSV